MSALRKIGIEPIRELPRVNQTAEKKSDFLAYFTPDLYEQAKTVYGPFMRKWGYRFPEQWGPVHRSWIADLKFRSLDLAGTTLVRTFRIGPSSRAPLVMSAREVVRKVWS